MAVLCVCFVLLTSYVVSGQYTYWSPDGVKDLWCAPECLMEITKIQTDHCCACNSIPEWETTFTNVSYQTLAIELFDPIMSITKLFNTTSYEFNSTFFSFTFINGRLQTFPENACDFRIVVIDVTNNMFTEIGKLSCFLSLDTLILKANKITFVSNETFKGMDKLRKVDLSYNLIRNMDLNIISSNGVLDFNFESNDMRQVDVTNFVAINKPMCGVSYANNRRTIDITNVVGFQLGENSSKMCNDVNFAGSTVSSLAVITITHNISSEKMGKYIPCGSHSYEGTRFPCDCNLAELLPLSFTDIQRLVKKEASEYVCETPESLYNISVHEVYSRKELHGEMKCDIKDNCHSRRLNCKCKCTSEPTRHTLTVDCSNQSCTDFPEVVPDSKYDITLIINNNYIRNVGTKQYFSRVKILDLSDNPVQNIHNSIDILVKATEIKIYNHTLQTLPKTVQHLHPDVFRFGKNGIPCTCENIWIGEWRVYKKASRLYGLYCSNYDNITIEDKTMECEEQNQPYWIISLMLSLLCVSIISMLIFAHFRFDFLIMKRRFLNSKPHQKWEIDLYISADEENDEVRYFVLRILDPFLRKKKLTTYIPFRDSIPGTTREDTVITNLKKCKYVLIIQSVEMYISTKQSGFSRRLEYSLAWNGFIKGQVEKILVLCFDNSQFDNFQYLKSKALNRVGMGFIVSTRTKCLKEKILETFDKPLVTRTMGPYTFIYGQN